jgi:hypothetical protein
MEYGVRTQVILIPDLRCGGAHGALHTNTHVWNFLSLSLKEEEGRV